MRQTWAVFLGLVVASVGCSSDENNVNWECILSDGQRGCSCYEAPITTQKSLPKGPACSKDTGYLCCYMHGGDDQQPGCTCLPEGWLTPADCEGDRLAALGRNSMVSIETIYAEPPAA